jgi:hypothetical protein
MLVTVMHQVYTRDVAVDTSGMCNHGKLIKVSPQQPGFSFDQPESRIDIRSSASLLNLECIRAGVKFSLQPRGTPHRYNLIEGFMSFALFVNSDLSISGTIFDADGNWTGATSMPNTVCLNTTHVAILECDGINMVRILLDGKMVAENYKVKGAVASIGQLGLAIGHWPDPPNTYTFEGTIFETSLQKYDKTSELTRYIDTCCYDREALRLWFKRVSQKGVSIKKIQNAGQSLYSATKDAAIALRAGDKTATEKQQATAVAIKTMLMRHDLSALESILKEFQRNAGKQLDKETITKSNQQIRNAIDDFGLDFTDWCELLKILGLSSCAKKRGR